MLRLPGGTDEFLSIDTAKLNIKAIGSCHGCFVVLTPRFVNEKTAFHCRKSIAQRAETKI